MEKKFGNVMYEVIIHLVLVALIFALFVFVTAGRTSSKEVKQQILEKQLALLIDSAPEGMSFSVYKLNKNGFISKIELKEGRVYAYIEDQKSSKGYPYFSVYDVSVLEAQNKYTVSVK